MSKWQAVSFPYVQKYVSQSPMAEWKKLHSSTKPAAKVVISTIIVIISVFSIESKHWAWH